jgi:pimeloyl-ACP methyl ester carboxylesterase
MATNHSASIEIRHGINSMAYFAFEPPASLLIFIHGFGGNAIGTWNHFPSLLLMDDDFKKSDIVFYGYDTFCGQAGDHAAEFYHFLDKITCPRLNGILPINQGLNERIYKNILLVAHSLGAIILRQALLLAEIDNRSWLDKTTMALFAPAHNGANIIPLAKEALPGFLKQIF